MTLEELLSKPGVKDALNQVWKNAQLKTAIARETPEEAEFVRNYCRSRFETVHKDDKLYHLVPVEETGALVTVARKLAQVGEKAVTDLQNVHDFAQSNENALRARIADLEESLASQRRVVKMKPLAKFTGLDLDGSKVEYNLTNLTASAYEMDLPQGTRYLVVIQTQTVLTADQRQQFTKHAAEHLAKKLGDHIVVMMLPGDGTEMTVLEMPPPYR